MTKDNKMTHKFKPQISLDHSKYHFSSDEFSVAEGDLVHWYKDIMKKSQDLNVHPKQICKWMDAENIQLDFCNNVSYKQGWISAQKFVEQKMSLEDSVSNLWVQS